MLVSVEFSINRRVPDPEISAQINYPRAPVQDRAGKLDRYTVR